MCILKTVEEKVIINGLGFRSYFDSLNDNATFPPQVLHLIHTHLNLLVLSHTGEKLTQFHLQQPISAMFNRKHSFSFSLRQERACHCIIISYVLCCFFQIPRSSLTFTFPDNLKRHLNGLLLQPKGTFASFAKHKVCPVPPVWGQQARFYPPLDFQPTHAT